MRNAVEILGEDKLIVRLNASIDPSDAHAIDVMYHKKCWNTHVVRVLRKHSNFPGPSTNEFERVARIAVEVEFIDVVRFIWRESFQHGLNRKYL